jgi:serine/threonine protein kinase
MSASGLRPIFPGAVIGDKYRVERVIASGGQGTVVEATHLRLRHAVAIKFPHVDEAHQADRWGRLFREARAAFRLSGEHVARVMDVDVVDGSPFIVMEYLRGIDLRAWLAERGPLPHEEAVGLLLQACDGVSEAHDLGIVHRDLKPSNLFLVDRGADPPQLKVLDFGMAKRVGPRASDADDPDLTEPLLVLGTPRYMSPEQARDSRSVDLRTDIWSLGVILQEMLTGRPVFRARSRAEVLAQVLLKNPTPLTLLRPDAPPELERVVLRCLQKAPEHRFASVRELSAALAGFAPSWAAPAITRIGTRAQPPLAMVAPVGSDDDTLDGGTTNEMITPPAPEQPGPGSAVTRILPARDQPSIRARKLRRTRVALGMAGLAAVALVAAWRGDGTLYNRIRPSLPPPLATAMAARPPSPATTIASPRMGPTVEPLAILAAQPPVADVEKTAASSKMGSAASTGPRGTIVRPTRKAARRAALARRAAPAPAPTPNVASIDRWRPGHDFPNGRAPASGVETDMDNPLDGRK